MPARSARCRARLSLRWRSAAASTRSSAAAGRSGSTASSSCGRGCGSASPRRSARRPTGQVIPVHELKAETGLPILVDGAQSVGAIPVDVGELDYYTVSCHKWLCGPEPTGALYVRDPELLRVRLPTYLSHQRIERDGTFVPKDGALRFDFGWLATPALAGLEAALDGFPDERYERAARAA